MLDASGDAESRSGNRDEREVYSELRRLAAHLLRGQRPSQTVRTTALVHEAYIKLGGPSRYADESHYLAVAARAMRQILIDHARSRRALKRGGNAGRVRLDEIDRALDEMNVDLLDLDDALIRLGQADERKVRVVELRFFGGLDIGRTADVLGIGHATVERDWSFARAWLCRELSGGDGDGQ